MDLQTFKGAYKSTFGKKNISEKVLRSAVYTLQYHFVQLPRDHKKLCQKNNFHVTYVFCIFPTNLLHFSKVRSILFWTYFYRSQPSKAERFHEYNFEPYLRKLKINFHKVSHLFYVIDIELKIALKIIRLNKKSSETKECVFFC